MLCEYLISTTLQYRVFSKKLKAIAFQLNIYIYNMHVENKNVNRKQFTIAQYINNLKMLHQDPKIVDHIIVKLEKIFRKKSTIKGNYYVSISVNTIEKIQLKF